MEKSILIWAKEAAALEMTREHFSPSKIRDAPAFLLEASESFIPPAAAKIRRPRSPGTASSII